MIETKYKDKEGAINEMEACIRIVSLDLSKHVAHLMTYKEFEKIKGTYIHARDIAIKFGMNVDRFPRHLKKGCRIHENGA